MTIQHRDPDSQREAQAPYNFVPLPERVVTVPEPFPHDLYSPERETGYFEVELTTLTPLYVRCGLSTREQLRTGDPRTAWQIAQAEKAGEKETRDFREEMKNTPDFFYTQSREEPVIPGSSLRGMLRSLLGIVTYSKVEGVTEKKLFYRSVDSPHYQSRMAQKLGMRNSGYDISSPKTPVSINAEAFTSKVEAGFLRCRRDGTYVIEKCEMARIQQNDLRVPFGPNLMVQRNANDPNGRPDWRCQHQTVWVDVDSTPQNYFFKAQPVIRQGQVVPNRFRHQNQYLVFRLATNPTRAQVAPTQEKAVVVLTGNIQYKHLAFVFLPQATPETIPVPNEAWLEDINERVVERFQDKDQITRWQQDAFPTGKPEHADRKKDGYLRDREPVFFLREAGKLVFFGRAQMFRLPYLHRPLDLVPESLRDRQVTDYADALFGYTDKRKDAKQGEIGRAYAGRISVSDATLVAATNGLWLDVPIVEPRILATPKPTCYQHYLNQMTDDRRNLAHYDTEGAQIRGHKLYWHQGAIEAGVLWENTPDNLVNNQVAPNSTQHTIIKPVRDGVTFKFRVYFENLTGAELGALAWTLHPQGRASQYAHKLGMGKSLGMGSVSLNKVELTLTNRAQRYATLFDADGWQTGETAATDKIAAFSAAFEAAMLEELGLDDTGAALCEVRRIAHLLRMLEWRDALSEGRQWRVGSQKLEDFKERYVLPSPLYEEEQQGLLDPRPKRRKTPRPAARPTESKGTPQPSDTPTSEQAQLPRRTTATVSSYRKAKVYVSLEGVEGFTGEISCPNAPTWPTPEPGDRYSVEVTYDKNNRVTSVRFRERA